jgi:hypothetical protein
MALVVEYHLLIKSAHNTLLKLDNEKSLPGHEGTPFLATG